MIHKIKAMYDEGRGSSIREIARTLKTSRNTVRKYLALDEPSIEAALGRYQEGSRYEVGAPNLYHGKHIPPAVLREQVGEAIWEEYFKFTFCRNPFDWFVSQWFWNTRPTCWRMARTFTVGSAMSWPATITRPRSRLRMRPLKC